MPVEAELELGTVVPQLSRSKQSLKSSFAAAEERVLSFEQLKSLREPFGTSHNE